jgi:replicative DNA helicase
MIADEVSSRSGLWRTNHALTGLATGYRDLDQLTSGLHRRLIIVAVPVERRPLP